MNPLIVIPARMASTRLPGKPLADIHGEPMIVHVWRRAMEAGIGPVLVAGAASREIVGAIEAAGGRAVLTRPDHPSGSDRIFEAVGALRSGGPARRDRQSAGRSADGRSRGDPSAVLEPLADPAVDIATLAIEIRDAAERVNPNVVKAVAALGPRSAGRARSLFHARRCPSGEGPLYHHIGIYAYRRAALERFVAAAAGAGSSSARSWSSCARWRPACASTWRSLTRFPSVSILRPTSSAPARCCQPRSLSCNPEPSAPVPSPSRARPAPIPISPAATADPGDDDACLARPSRRPSPPCGRSRAQLAMMPIDNSVAGRVADIHHLLPDSGLHIIGEHFQPVVHHLLAVTGATIAGLKTVHSHVHALPQCRQTDRANWA